VVAQWLHRTTMRASGEGRAARTGDAEQATFRLIPFLGTWTGGRYNWRLRWIHYFPVGTFCFNSSNQLSTMLICVNAACPCSMGLSIKNRWPSGETS